MKLWICSALALAIGCSSPGVPEAADAAPGGAGALQGGAANVGGSAGQPANAGGANYGGAPIAGAANGGAPTHAGAGGGASGAAGSNGSIACGGAPASGTASWVCLNGAKLMVAKRKGDGTLGAQEAYVIKGVGWAPTGKGERADKGYTAFYTKYVDLDLPHLAELSVNTVRTYNALEANQNGTAVLDKLYAKGIMVVMSVAPSWWDMQGNAYLDVVNKFKGHPAILMWSVGQELNLNRLYNDAISVDEAVRLSAAAIDAIHQADPGHPVAVSWSNSPFESGGNYFNVLGKADVWSLNLYTWLDLKSRFDAFQSHTGKPIIVGEYGADAWNAKTNAEDQASQATAVTTLTQQVLAYASAKTTHTVIGGFTFELTDDWGKGSNPAVQTTTGFGNGGVYADGYANEAWWGLLTIDRVPRQAFTQLKALYAAP